MNSKRQRQLPFDTTKEQQRLERVERICGDVPKLTTGARLFDERAYRDATAIATSSNTPRPQN